MRVLEARPKLFRSESGDDGVGFRCRVESTARNRADQVDGSELAVLSFVRSLIFPDIDVVHGSEEPDAMSVGLELVGSERTEVRGRRTVVC